MTLVFCCFLPRLIFLGTPLGHCFLFFSVCLWIRHFLWFHDHFFAACSTTLGSSCLSCSSSSVCSSCDTTSGSFLLDSDSHCYSPCPAGYYGNTKSGFCEGIVCLTPRTGYRQEGMKDCPFFGWTSSIPCFFSPHFSLCFFSLLSFCTSCMKVCLLSSLLLFPFLSCLSRCSLCLGVLTPFACV